MDARKALDMAMSEAQLMQTIIDAARLQGYLVFHTFDSRRSQPGFPDLICVKGPVILALECKRQTGKTTVSQDAWLDAFQCFADAIAGRHVAVLVACVVRPSDLDNVLDTIHYYANANWTGRKTA